MTRADEAGGGLIYDLKSKQETQPHAEFLTMTLYSIDISLTMCTN